MGRCRSLAVGGDLSVAWSRHRRIDRHSLAVAVHRDGETLDAAVHSFYAFARGLDAQSSLISAGALAIVVREPFITAGAAS